METLYKALENSPGIVGILIALGFFLRFTNSMMASHAKRTDEFIATVKDINQQAADDRARAYMLAMENTKALTANTEATKSMTTAFKEVSCKYPTPHRPHNQP